MNKEETLRQIASGRIVAILRGDYQNMLEEIGAVLTASGITAVEVTLNSPAALASINRLATRYGSLIAVGAGTVLRPDDVVRAADAGAQFIVAPNRDLRVIAAAQQQGIAALPGCFTPSEIVEALDAGADAIKIFPAETLGPGYIKAVLAPLSGIRLVPTGGVTAESTIDYLRAGAWALGVGSELVSPDVKTTGGLERLSMRAAAFVSAVTEA